jgi:hypothetical protein
MAGTLWVTDALFAFAAGGARAFHLHWGHGGLPYEGGSPNVGVQTNFDYNVRFLFGVLWGSRSHQAQPMEPRQQIVCPKHVYIRPQHPYVPHLMCGAVLSVMLCHADAVPIQALPQRARTLVRLPVLGVRICRRLQQGRRHTVYSSMG